MRWKYCTQINTKENGTKNGTKRKPDKRRGDQVRRKNHSIVPRGPQT